MNETPPEVVSLIEEPIIAPVEIVLEIVPEVIPEVALISPVEFVLEIEKEVVEEPIIAPVETVLEIVKEVVEEPIIAPVEIMNTIVPVVEESIDPYDLYFPNGSETDEEYKEEEVRSPSSIVAEESSTMDNHVDDDTDDGTDDGNLIIEEIKASQKRDSVNKFIKLVNSTEESPLKCSMLVDAKHAELIAVSTPEKNGCFRYFCCF